MKKRRKVLIITSSCGGGLLQAAIAKEQELKAEDPNVDIATRDVVKDWFWKILAHFALFAWNGAQKTGKVYVLESLLNLQRAYDWLFWPSMFFRSLQTVFKEDVDHVIDTQPLGTSAILRSLRIYNYFRKKQVMLEKIVVDLPTEKNTHFFRSVKSLPPKSRKIFRMITIPPLLHPGQTVDEFWKKNCNMTEKEVVYEYYAIRQAFRKLQGKNRSAEAFTIRAELGSDEEKELLMKTAGRGKIRMKFSENNVLFEIAPKDLVLTVLLGSQPSYDGSKGYVKGFIQLLNEKAMRRNVHLFVFCGTHAAGKPSLVRQIADLVSQTDPYPTYLSVVPLTFQNDETIAQVFYRSNLTCTRSGGQTAMELMCVMGGQIWIHSEAKKRATQELTIDQLLKGIPGWEAGNAVYLHRTRGAKVVTPDSFLPMGRDFFNYSSKR